MPNTAPEDVARDFENAKKTYALWGVDVDKALQTLIQANRNQIVVDLKGVEYMSSAGIRALVSALKAAKAGGGDLCIAQPSTRARDVLELAGLTTIFAIHEDLIEAVGSF